MWNRLRGRFVDNGGPVCLLGRRLLSSSPSSVGSTVPGETVGATSRMLPVTSPPATAPGTLTADTKRLLSRLAATRPNLATSASQPPPPSGAAAAGAVAPPLPPPPPPPPPTAPTPPPSGPAAGSDDARWFGQHSTIDRLFGGGDDRSRGGWMDEWYHQDHDRRGWQQQWQHHIKQQQQQHVQQQQQQHQNQPAYKDTDRYQWHLRKKNKTSLWMGNSSSSSSPPAGHSDTPFLAPSFDKMSKMVLRGTEFDGKGNVKTVSGLFLKSDLCQLHDLQPRDLRTIDNYRNQLPSILVRPSTMVVNLEHIKAIIKADMIVLFDTDIVVDKQHQSMFIFDLQERLRTASGNALPFELRGMEAILISVCNVLRDDFNQLAPKVNALLRKLEGDLDRSTMVSILEMSKRLTSFEARVNSIQHALMEVLNSDEDMAGMYLTTKVNTGLSQPSSMHQEVEFMFEFYHKQIEEISSMTSELSSHIRTTQTIVRITLDSQRNSLLQLELKIAMGTFSVSLGALACGIFGMNLPSGFEGSPVAFYLTVTTLSVAALTAFTVLLRRMRSVVRGITHR